MSLTLRLVGRAQKRGLIKRLPSPEQLAGDASAWVQREHADTLRLFRCGPTEAGAELGLDLHPAASPVVVSFAATGEVVAQADTSAVGPGYHTYLARLFERLGADLEIAWTPSTDALTERAAIERAHLAWLGRALVRAREQRRLGATGIHIGTPAGITYAHPAAVITPLGPRDDAWLEAALSDARLAADIRPWWADAMDGRYLLNRALTILWQHVRWRTPADDAERAMDDEALRLLRRSFPLEPSLPFPWRAWHELIGLRAVPDPMARQVAERAAASPAGPAVGYRRSPVTIVHAGWALQVPGSFTETRTDEEWTGGEAGRTITIAGVETGAGGSPMRPEQFLARVANDLGSGALDHRGEDVMGRARLSTDTSSGIEIGVLDGYSAVTGRGAAVRITFDDPNDWEWAVGTWRALRPSF